MAMSEFWAGKRVAVTGCAGFLGSHLARALVDRGASVLGLDIVSDSPCWRVHGLSGVAELTRCNIFDRNNLLFHLDPDRFRPESHPAPRAEIVFHLAGVSGIHEAQRDAVRAFEVNTRAAWMLLDVCQELGVKATVLASSNHVYGSRASAHSEGEACQATDVYGLSKGAQDFVARAFGGKGVPVATLRHVNCFGPADPHESHIVTGAVLSVLAGKAPTVRSDGTPIKAYLHVADVVAAYLLLAETLARGGILFGEAFNCAPRAPISALALVDKIIVLAGLDLVPDVLSEDLTQSGYVEILDASRLRRLGWEPHWSLEEGLMDTLTWYREHKGMEWLTS